MCEVSETFRSPKLKVGGDFMFVPDSNLARLWKRRKKEIIAIQYLHKQENERIRKTFIFFSFHRTYLEWRRRSSSSGDKREKPNIGHRHLIVKHNSLKCDQFVDLRCSSAAIVSRSSCRSCKSAWLMILGRNFFRIELGRVSVNWKDRYHPFVTCTEWPTSRCVMVAAVVPKTSRRSHENIFSPKLFLLNDHNYNYDVFYCLQKIPQSYSSMIHKQWKELSEKRFKLFYSTLSFLPA